MSYICYFTHISMWLGFLLARVDLWSVQFCFGPGILHGLLINYSLGTFSFPLSFSEILFVYLFSALRVGVSQNWCGSQRDSSTIRDMGIQLMSSGFIASVFTHLPVLPQPLLFQRQRSLYAILAVLEVSM